MFVTESVIDAVEDMADRIVKLEEENRALTNRNSELKQERDLCMREVMRLRMLLDAGRTVKGWK